MAVTDKESLRSQVVPPVEVPEIVARPGRDGEAIAKPAAEIRESVRAALEKGVADSRAAFAKAKVTADEAVTAFEQSFAAAKDGAVAINTKALEALRANAEANFEFMKASFAAKSLSDLVALQSEFARKQVEAVTGQAKDIGALTQKTVAETSPRSRNRSPRPSGSRSKRAGLRRDFLPRVALDAACSSGGVLFWRLPSATFAGALQAQPFDTSFAARPGRHSSAG